MLNSVKDNDKVVPSTNHVCNSEERKLAPNTCGVMDRVLKERKEVVKEITSWGISVGYMSTKTDFKNTTVIYPVRPIGNKGFTFEGNRSDIVLPIVTQGGLIETCFRHPLPGWVKLAAETTGGYATCINIGNDAEEEILNTIYLNMVSLQNDCVFM